MISEVLLFLKNHLNAYLGPETSQEEKVVFVDGDKMEPLSFKVLSIDTLSP